MLRSTSGVPKAGSLWHRLPAACAASAALILAVPLAEAATPPVEPSATFTGTAVPGGVLIGTGTCKINDGSTFLNADWSQVNQAESVRVRLSADKTKVKVILPPAREYKDKLLHYLAEDKNPDSAVNPDAIPLPGMQDRWQVVGINHLALEHAGDVEIQFRCKTTSGQYSKVVAIATQLPWHPNPGLTNVPKGVPVLLAGKAGDPPQTTWNWQLTVSPQAGEPNSTAVLQDAATQSPWFTPDVAGTYQLYEGVSGVQMTVFALPWAGLVDRAATLAAPDGRPMLTCSAGCHSSDQIAKWRQTGHAEIFTQNINAGPTGHYGEACLECHAVGFNKSAVNGGFDEAPGYNNMLGLMNKSTTAWTTILMNAGNLYQDVAKLANVQCENCHGPQDNLSHHQQVQVAGDPTYYASVRASLSSDVCAACHGEPPRHSRFQQWQRSLHADYTLPVDEGESNNCARCHTANGFIPWTVAKSNALVTLNTFLPDGDPSANGWQVPWAVDEIHSQTCVACHDPHDTGTTSGNTPNAKVRITGNTATLIAGFKVTDIGKGAVCATCHNSRRGFCTVTPPTGEPCPDDNYKGRNDTTWALPTMSAGTGLKDGAPHFPTQTDIMAGQSMYFVSVAQGLGQKSGHGNGNGDNPNTCVTCHMEATDPPPDLSYNLGGTNHTFYASPDISLCQGCHDGLAPTYKALVDSTIPALESTLKAAIGEKYLELMQKLVTDGNVLGLGLSGKLVQISAPTQLVHAELDPERQRILVTYNIGSGNVTTDALSLRNPTATTPGIDIVSGPKASSNGLYGLAAAAGQPDKTMDTLMKATWNRLMLYADPEIEGGRLTGRRAVHAPGFVLTALTNALTAVQTPGVVY